MSTTVSTGAGEPAGPPPGIPAEYAAFVDDAAVFPPGNAALPDALRGYRAHVQAPYAALVGPFVIDDSRVPELVELLRSEGASEPLPVTVVASGGAGSLEPAARWAVGSADLDVRSLEVALRDLDDLPGAARRTVAAVLALEAAGNLTDATVYVEAPLAAAGQQGWLTALDEIAAADLRLKVRTGGGEPDAFPPAAVLGAAIDAALDRELAFKCTAGLHRAVRHRAADTGFEHHGFLNVLLAVRAGLDGDDIVQVLELSDPDAVVDRARTVGADALARARRWFTSFGCCGVHEPYDDLRGLGLLGDRTAR